jgi:hypothetical protein
MASRAIIAYRWLKTIHPQKEVSASCRPTSRITCRRFFITALAGVMFQGVGSGVDYSSSGGGRMTLIYFYSVW